jgi:putative nucleotidyltransferase with HDIG domain
MDREKIWQWIRDLPEPTPCVEAAPTVKKDDGNQPQATPPIPEIIADPELVRAIRNLIGERFQQLRQLRNYRRHAAEIAVGAFLLAREAGEPEELCRLCATAGYLHDLGKLAVAAALSRRADPLSGTHWRQMQTVLDREQHELGTNHAEAGTRVARRLQLSTELRDAIQHHHDPERAEGIVAGFVFLAHYLNFENDELARVLEDLPMDLLGRLNLSVLDFLSARDQFMARKRQELQRQNC